MRETVTISLPPALRVKLDKCAKQEHLNRSDLIRDAIKHYLSIKEFRRLRESLLPMAAKKGLYTDEDIFNKVS